MKRFLVLLLAAACLLPLFSACAFREPSADRPSSGTDTGVEPEDRFDPAEIVISEVMPDNERVVLGHSWDWIELYSREEGTVDLSPYALTDDLASPNAYPLTGKTVCEGEYLLIVLPEDAPFHLSSAGETVYLTLQGKPVSQLTYGPSEHGESFDGAGICSYPTPGQPNTKEGYLAYLEATPLPELYLSEILSSGDGDDWVEVHNASDRPLDLSSYTLTDKRKEPARYAFPAVTLNPGEYFTVTCSGVSGETSAPFKISSEGETLYLLREGVFIDAVTLPSDVVRNESYGRRGRQFRYFAAPTPGSENGEGYENTVDPVTASLPSGLYDAPVTVELQGSGTIYYTLDGSRPTAGSAVYSGPLVLEKNTTVRTFATDGVRTGQPTAFTYLIGVSHDLPVVSIALPQASLTGEETGILNHIDETFEYEAQLTLLENGEQKFTVPFGFRLHGHDSRKGAKQNFQLRFRSEYGAGTLKYKLFDNREFDEFNSLLLKGGSEDWSSALLRDELCTAVADGTTALSVQAMKPVVLYLDGEYWGIYYLRERFSDDYVASHFGVSAESVDMVYSSGGYAQTGSAAGFTAMKQYLKSHTAAENHAYLSEQTDAVSLMDWYIVRSYFGDRDLANIRRFRSSEGDGKWRWMFFDLDWSFYNTDAPVSWTVNNYGGDHDLINAWLAHPQGRHAFMERTAELMRTVLNEQYINSVLDSLVAAIETEIPRDRARWGRSVDGWEASVQKIRNYVKDGVRNEAVKSDLKAYFGLDDEAMTRYFG